MTRLNCTYVLSESSSAGAQSAGIYILQKRQPKMLSKEAAQDSRLLDHIRRRQRRTIHVQLRCALASHLSCLNSETVEVIRGSCLPHSADHRSLFAHLRLAIKEHIFTIHTSRPSRIRILLSQIVCSLKCRNKPPQRSCPSLTTPN